MSFTADEFHREIAPLGDAGHAEAATFRPHTQGVEVCRAAGLDAIALVTLLLRNGDLPPSAAARAREIVANFNTGIRLREQACLAS